MGRSVRHSLLALTRRTSRRRTDPKAIVSDYIPVIDVFAGPGGLGEGFSSYVPPRGRPGFELRLSVEKDEWAVQTLQLRAFQRQLGSRMPAVLRKLLAEGLTRQGIRAILDAYPREGGSAREEVWHQTLGLEHADKVRERVRARLPRDRPWVLIGGPPCQAYSLAGRSRNRGKADYVPEADHRQTLYIEYLQIIADHEPAAFVMENVKGLLSATLASQRMFDRILDDLRDPAFALKKAQRRVHGQRRPRYRIVPVVAENRPQNQMLFDGGDSPKTPGSFVVRAEQFGVPQARHRIILLGIREDMDVGKRRTLVRAASPSVKETLAGLPRLRSGLTDRDDTDVEWRRVLRDAALARWFSACDTDVTDRIERVVSGLSMPRSGRGREYLECDTDPSGPAVSFGGYIEGAICNHTSRAHIASDLERYLFASAYAWCHGKSPEIKNFPEALRPNHRNVQKALSGGHFADRFRVQLRNQPSTTITSHISKDGHYYIHYDPAQCRSLTVREAARLQTFPDDYVFVGPRTAQYHQVGNAVPPFLARQIAEIVAHMF